MFLWGWLNYYYIHNLICKEHYNYSDGIDFHGKCTELMKAPQVLMPWWICQRHSMDKFCYALLWKGIPSKQARHYITRERSIILQINELKHDYIETILALYCTDTKFCYALLWKGIPSEQTRHYITRERSIILHQRIKWLYRNHTCTLLHRHTHNYATVDSRNSGSLKYVATSIIILTIWLATDC